ncbi:MAG: FlgD immunoglobulin-like domain containing protein [Candidatus Eisenbacteria bacterium]
MIYSIPGEGAGDTFGFVLEAVGDLNGDGASEFVTSSPYRIESGLRVGKAYLIDGATGSVLRTHVGETVNGRFGFRVSPAGDFDADGTPDYAVSAPGDEGSLIAGAVYVYSGNLALIGAAALLWSEQSAVPGARLGRGLGAAGDLDGDGYGDLLVGAPHEDVGGTDTGTVYVISGRTHSTLRTHQGTALARLGYACAPLDDRDGDGVPEYLLGAPGGGSGGDGEVRVVDGATGATLLTLEPTSPSAQEFGGFFVSSPGDLDGDGHDDIFVGDYADNAAGPFTGHTYLFDGITGDPLPYEVAGDSANDWNGFGGRVIGDFDQDGRADFVTNFFHNPETGAPTGGRIVLYSGATGAALRTITSLEGNASGTYGEWLGYDVTGLGDVNGDGVPDILVSGALNDDAGPSAGMVYVIAGRLTTPAEVPESDADGTDRLPSLVLAPNPMRQNVRATFSLSTAGPASLTVYDAAGREVRRIFEGQMAGGIHRSSWDGSDAHGVPVSRGIYYLRLVTHEGGSTARVVRIR